MRLRDAALPPDHPTVRKPGTDRHSRHQRIAPFSVAPSLCHVIHCQEVVSERIPLKVQLHAHQRLAFVAPRRRGWR